MFFTFRPLLLVALLSAAGATSAAAQAQQPIESKEAAYTRTITERAAKIVATLGLTDEAKSTKVRDVIANQYRELNTVHEARKAQLAALKAQPKDDKTEAATKKIEDQTTAALDKLHGKYLKQLGRYLTADQVALVKDGMTYRVLPITMTAYEDMLPNLTAAQKAPDPGVPRVPLRGTAPQPGVPAQPSENPVQRSRARALAGARRAECRRYSQRCSCLPVRAHDPPAQRPRYFGFSFFLSFLYIP